MNIKKCLFWFSLQKNFNTTQLDDAYVIMMTKIFKNVKKEDNNGKIDETNKENRKVIQSGSLECLINNAEEMTKSKYKYLKKYLNLYLSLATFFPGLKEFDNAYDIKTNFINSTITLPNSIIDLTRLHENVCFNIFDKAESILDDDNALDKLNNSLVKLVKNYLNEVNKILDLNITYEDGMTLFDVKNKINKEYLTKLYNDNILEIDRHLVLFIEAKHFPNHRYILNNTLMKLYNAPKDEYNTILKDYLKDLVNDLYLGPNATLEQKTRILIRFAIK